MPPEWPPFIAPGGYGWRQQYPARRDQLACCGEGSLRFTHLRVHFLPDAHDDIAHAELSPQSDPLDANVEACVQDVVESWLVQPAPRSDMLGQGRGSVTLSFRF